MTYRSAAEAAKSLLKLERRRDRSLYRDPPPVRVVPPVTLAPVAFLDEALSDEDVGLTPDPIAQAKAERFLQAVHGHRAKQDAGILAELKRLAERPTPRWMADKRSAA